jgi:hypothetical protein
MVKDNVVKMRAQVPRDISDAVINALHTSIFNEAIESKIREFVLIAYERGFMDGLGSDN